MLQSTRGHKRAACQPWPATPGWRASASRYCSPPAQHRVQGVTFVAFQPAADPLVGGLNVADHGLDGKPSSQPDFFLAVSLLALSRWMTRCPAPDYQLRGSPDRLWRWWAWRRCPPAASWSARSGQPGSCRLIACGGRRAHQPPDLCSG